MRLPQGYETVMGERGETLSGGQGQRVAIARAMIRNAPILILDEPTSSLDAVAEALTLEALERLRCGRTTFIIAHRLSTVRTADQIVVLEGGRIVEHGTHENLVASGGHYRRLLELQFGIVEPPRPSGASAPAPTSRTSSPRTRTPPGPRARLPTARLSL